LKLPFPRSKNFRPSGSAPQLKDEDDDSSDDDFDGNNGPWLRKTSAHSSNNQKSSGIRTSNGHPSSSQGSNSRPQPPSQRCATNSDQTLQTKPPLSVDGSSIPTFNANSVREAGSLNDPILRKFEDWKWGNRASSVEHNRLGDNLEDKEEEHAIGEACMEADDIIFVCSADEDQVAVIPSRELLFGLQLPGEFLLSRELLHLQMRMLTLLELLEGLLNPPSFCDANNDDNIVDIEKFLRKRSNKAPNHSRCDTMDCRHRRLAVVQLRGGYTRALSAPTI